MNLAEPSLGARLRGLRAARGLPVRKVAAATDMDASLLSRIESGQRLPSAPQAKALAAFYGLPSEELLAARIAGKFWKDHAADPAVRRAVTLIQETAPAYVVNKSGHNRGKASE